MYGLPYELVTKFIGIRGRKTRLQKAIVFLFPMREAVPVRSKVEK